MNNLDFLNSPPQHYIFGKRTNKTKFGGILFLIYLIIMIFISLIYILDYALNEKYDIESYLIDTFFENLLFDPDFDDSKINPDINPKVDFNIALLINDDNYINKNELMKNTFLVYDNKLYKGSFHEALYDDRPLHNYFIDFYISKKIFEGVTFLPQQNKEMQIVYKCNNSNCSNLNMSFFDSISINTKDFEIINDGPIPILVKDDCFQTHVCDSYAINFFEDNKTLIFDLELTTIVYEEKKGISRLIDKLFNKSSKYEISYIDNYSSYKRYYNYEDDDDDDYGVEFDNQDPNYDNEEEEIDYKNYHILSSINTLPGNKYLKYRRTKIGFLDVLAKIGALFGTFNTIFKFVFIFYSRNFDNYKIIDNILQMNLYNSKTDEMNKKQIKLNNSKSNQIELTKLDIIKDEKDNITFPLISDINETENEKEKNIKSKIDENVNLEENKNGTNNKEIKFDDNKGNIEYKTEDKILPKLSFFDFYFNNIYCKSCKRREKQDILSLCNKIISKYNSIDYVLYNNILFENLLKDYKWNNPSLNNLKNIELIKELFKLI